jgi:hypothetical protein
MASVYSKDLEVYSAEQFKNNIDGANVYLTFGYQSPWTNDQNPDQANTSVESYNEVWRTMIGGKQLFGSDVYHVIPRFNWTTNTVYMAYDHTQDSLTKGANTAYYVITDDFNVYKCIANNYGQPSIYKPTSTNPGIMFQAADQYYWKYMYTLNGNEQQRFTTNSFIPVKTLTQDDNSLQWQVQQDAVPGAINSIVVTSGGEGYLYQQIITVTVTGDGQFANAYAVVNTQTDTVQSIVIDNYGSGYTYANVYITSNVGKYATARAIISPPGGHGSDPLYELGGSYIMINPQLDGNENGVLSTKNDYRQIALLADPVVYGTTNNMTNLAFSQAMTLTLSQSSSTTDYINDEIVYQGPNLSNAYFTGVVVAWDSANSLLKINNTNGTPVSNLIYGYTSSAQRYVSGNPQYPDCQPYKGHILYKDNITPISRADDQNEDFKIVLSF